MSDEEEEPIRAAIELERRLQTLEQRELGRQGKALARMKREDVWLLEELTAESVLRPKISEDLKLGEMVHVSYDGSVERAGRPWTRNDGKVPSIGDALVKLRLMYPKN